MNAPSLDRSSSRAFDEDSPEADRRLPSRGALNRELVAHIHGQTPISATVSMAVSGITAAVLSASLPLAWLLPWVGAIWALSFYQLYRWRRLKPERLPREISARGPRRVILLSIVNGVVWAGASGFYPWLAPTEQVLVVTALLGMAAGAATTLAPIPLAAIGFQSSVIVPMIAYFLSQSSPAHVAVGALALVYLMAMVASVRTVYRGFMRMVVARHDNAQLAARFRDFASAASDWWWELDAELRFVFVSSSGQSSALFDRVRLLGKTWREVGLSEVSDSDWASLESHLAKLESFQDFQFTLKDDGRLQRWSIAGRPIFDQRGRFAGYRGVGQDISERVTVERRLRDAESTLRDAIDCLDDSFALFDADDRLVVWNRRYADFSRPVAHHFRPGVTFSDMVRLAVPYGLYPQAEGRVDAWLAERLGIRRSADNFTRDAFYGGRWLRASDKRTSSGGIVSVRTDITDLKAREAELAGARQQADAANLAKSEFLANMSHEMRTPLNGVIGMIELLLDGHLAPEQRQRAELARSSAEHLLELIGNVLDMSKIEAGAVRLDEAPFDLVAVVEGAAHVLAPKAHEKGLDFVVDLAPEAERRLVGDRTRLRQVLTNLIGNAIKFTEAGSVEIIVDGTATDDGKFDLRIVVRDTGIGIPTGIATDLFGKFVQADQSITRRFGGTGLGLAISKHLVQAMGGRIGFSSQEGRGSSFKIEVTLPTAASEVESSSFRGVLAGRRVLVADPHTASRKSLARLLRTWDLAVEEEETAATLLGSADSAASRREFFDFVIFDHRLVEDSAVVAAAIRYRTEAPNAKYVLCSPHVSTENLPEGQLPTDAILLKPMRRYELGETLVRLVSDAALPSTDAIPASTSPLRSDGLIGRRVLLAEDNEANRRVFSQFLTGFGCRVDMVGNGADAVSAASTAPYDLILMDVQMPGLDGLEATRRIRGGSGPNRQSPIVALTGNAFAEDVTACHAAGMSDHVAKPLRRRTLEQALLRHIGHPSARRSATG